MSESEFLKLLSEHKEYINKDFNVVITELVSRSQTHDMDKIFNNETFAIYNKYFPNLKKIPYGTSEYLNYERENFTKAHQNHGQNRHHFYSRYNKQKDTNLIDLLEAIIDINASDKQYNENTDIEVLMNGIEKKGILKLELEELIKNTIEFINKE